MPNKAVCEGEVYIKEDGRSYLEFYTEEFVLDDSVKTINEARSVIHKGMIADRLRTSFPNYLKWSTCQVVELKETSEQSKTADLDKLLLEASRLNCIPDNIANYKRPDHKMKALQRAIDDAKSPKRVAKKEMMVRLEE